MKRKMKTKRKILSLLLVFSMLLGIMLSSEKIYAASPYTWAGTPTISLSNNSYYKISDMTTYGKNYSTLFSNVNYNNYYTAVTTRVTYFKKVAVSAGQQLRFITADGDIASGSASTTSSRNIMYSLTEFDSNGNPLYETNWVPLSSTWVAGQTSNGLAIQGAGSRSNVAYIVFIFKWNDGYTVAGQGNSNITTSQVMADVKNLYIVKGTTLSYTLSYNANGGSCSTSSKSVTYGSTYGSLPTPTRTGYTFNGWYTAASGGSKIVSSTAMNRASNHTLYAQWAANKYTIKYNGNGATSGSTANSSHAYGTAKTLTSNGFKRTGYTFKGWSTSSSATTATYSNGQSVSNLTATNGGTINLYAVWTHNKYTVTYDANGGSTANTTKNYYYNDSVDLSPVAEKSGKIFVGWNTDPNATKAMESFVMPDCATSSNSDYKNDWEVTLYAIYTIPVSDVANHTYPDYEPVKDEEVYFRVWEVGNEKNIRVYPLTYTRDTNTMKYHYVLPTTDISDFVNGMTSYGYEILVFDNAGNYTSLYKSSATPPPVPVKYWQTVKHYLYDQYLQTWVKFHETTENVLEGLTYTPAYTTPPAGYKTSHIDSEYVVSGAKTSNAYYIPIDYTLTFDPNGGLCEVTEKTITFNDYYGTMPTPSREGYEFIGWYTENEGGTEIKSSHKYLTPADTTVYAHWKVLEFPVTYDYWTNGGSSAEEVSGKTEYAQDIDLSPKAYKEGWEFVGWNTDSTATTGLDSMNMPARPVTLYAIYQKDITLTIIEQNDSGQITRSQTKTIYNTEKEASFSMTEENRWSGWNFLGWTDGTLATDYPIVSIGNEYKISESSTLYGLYTTTVTLSYDTNGSSMVIDDQTKDCYYNASGDALYPEYVIAEAPELSQHSFVSWMDKDGDEYMPGEKHSFDKDMILTSKWDRHPEIEAYDRYFTLEQAQSGEITEEELLKKVVGTDLEDGTLVNGVDVIVKDYSAQDFASLDTDKEIEITYQATDSFGNIVTKTITVNVTDTTVRKSKTKRYVRFISSQFFQDSNGDFVPTDKGGLEETSLWRTDMYRLSLLEEIFRGNDVDVEVWIFTQKELKEIKEKS